MTIRRKKLAVSAGTPITIAHRPLGRRHLAVLGAGLGLLVVGCPGLPDDGVAPRHPQTIKPHIRAGLTINVPNRAPQPPATVAIIKDNNVNYATMVSQALTAALGSGGIANLVHSGDTVLIKPNLVYSSANAVTDWRVVKALVDQIKTVNGGASITIADGSASQDVFAIMNAQGFTAANFPGVTFANYNDNTTNPTDTYVLADKRTGANKQIPGLVADADVYIDVPKMKTHYHAGYTGALKNLGIGTGPLPLWTLAGGSAKAGLHHDIRSEIVDHIACRVPDLTVMDAISAMEGQGPVSGTMVTMNLVLASTDPLALDAVACSIMEIPPTLITHMALAANENIGIIDLNNITVTGNTSIAAVQHSFVRATPGDVQGPTEPGVIPYRNTTVIRTAPASVTIDGDLSEWGYANAMNVDATWQVKSAAGWGGTADSSLVALSMYNSQYLYLAMHVFDDTKLANNNTGAAIVNGDGVELYLSTYLEQYNTTARSYGGSYDYHLAISYASTPQAYMLSHNQPINGATIVKVDTSDGYVIEARIPWSNFGSPTLSPVAMSGGFTQYRQLGLNVAVNDADTAPSTVNHKLIWNKATDSDIETNPIKIGMSYVDPAGGLYGNPTYTLTTSATNGSITKSPDLSSYSANRVVTLTAVPNSGYVFSGWSGDATGTTNPLSVTMDRNKSVTASFQSAGVLTTITVSPSSATVNTSQTRQFTAIGYDQNGVPVSPQPTFTWTVSGGGTIDASGLFTAGTTAGGPYTITASSGGISGTASVTVSEASTAVYQINAGSSSAVSPFAADQYSSGGTQRSVTNAITISGISNPAPMAVYQTERYGDSTYTLPNLTPGGAYLVRLHFAELFQTAAGARVFNVAINGTTVLSNFDIFAEVGANYTAVVREFTATANGSGQIVIQFQTVTDNATIVGIEIIALTPNDPPTIVTPAAATPNPVPGTTTALSVLGDDDGGEASLTYTWATVGTPPAAVSFSANGSNAAKNTTATFAQAGSYTLQVTVADASGATVTSSVPVTVSQTLTSIAVSPTSATVNIATTQAFTASARDQFGIALGTQPTFTWTVSGGGTINASGLFTAGATAGGPYTVTATGGGQSGTASVTVSATPTTVYQINTGSNSAVSPFTADQYASGGTLRTVTNTITLTGVTDPAPMAVYQSERYGNSTYTLPNLTPGSEYLVRLHFAELYQTATGRRVFNVVINGTTVLPNFDIYAATGARYKATVREFTATANASGQIVIQFQTVTDNATIEGIEILAVTPNLPPTIVNAASATPNPVSGTTTALSVLGADDGGEASLTYTWAAVGTPPAPVTFSANGTNAAKNSTATFTQAGSYTLQATVRDAAGLTTTSSVAVTVNQTLTSIGVAPASSTLAPFATQQFVATARDQFGTALGSQPTFAWTVSAGGTIDATGLFTAGTTAGGPYTVTAQSGGVSGTATVTVVIPNQAPTIVTPAAAEPNPVPGTTTALSVLGDDDAGEASLIYTWATTGSPPAPVSFSVNGSNAAKNTTATFTQAGSYTLRVTVADQPGLTVTSSVSVTVNQTLTSIVVSPASATVNTSASQQFSATARDQFGTNLAPQPSFAWTVSGGGSISTSGLFTAGATAGGPYTVTAASGGKSGTASVTVSATPTTVYQINTGSNNAVSPYSADQYGSGGTLRTVTNTITLTGVTDPAPMAVYQSERYGNSTYTLPNLTAGSQYTVRLHFAELYQTATGRRVFNVVINGTTVLPNFDIYAATGARYKATVREFTATANASGQIVINFQTVTDNATIEGIEVIALTPNNPPTIATAAAASPNPVPGTTSALSVLGADDGGEASLTYTWATIGTPPAAVAFSANGTNAAKNTTVTFTQAGNYTLQATVRDAAGLTATSSVAVAVDQTLTSIVVTPASATVEPPGFQQFTATARDQFGTALVTQPAFAWTVSGGGTIDANGVFTPNVSAGGPYTVTAESGGIAGTATVTVAAANVAPTIATAAAASPNPVAGSTTALSVLGDDDGGEANLTYTWATTGTPPAPVSFSANGTNAAKNTTATFTKAGSYTFQVTVRDVPGLTATSSVAVTVNQTLTSIEVSPSSATVNTSATQQFTATARDQFATNLSPQPTFAWTVSGGGSINTSGLFTAGSTAGGPYTVTASSGGVNGTATVSVTAVNAAPTIATAASASPNPVSGSTAALSVLGADDGGEANLTYTWATTGTPPAPVSFSANGTNAAKNTTATFTKAGSYGFQVTVRDAPGLTATSSVTVTVNQTLTSIVVSPASATVNTSATQQFTATARDQFATNLSPQPTFTWTVSGGGTINASGLFTAGSTAGGPYTVTASSGGKSGTASVTVTASSTPCAGLCSNPVVFTGPNYQSGNLGTGATCHQTTASLNGGNCSNIDARTLTVNGTAMSCNGWALPAKRNGGYCIQVTAGTPSWTSFATW